MHRKSLTERGLIYVWAVSRFVLCLYFQITGVLIPLLSTMYYWNFNFNMNCITHCEMCIIAPEKGDEWNYYWCDHEYIHHPILTSISGNTDDSASNLLQKYIAACDPLDWIYYNVNDTNWSCMSYTFTCSARRFTAAARSVVLIVFVSFHHLKISYAIYAPSLQSQFEAIKYTRLYTPRSCTSLVN